MPGMMRMGQVLQLTPQLRLQQRLRLSQELRLALVNKLDFSSRSDEQNKSESTYLKTLLAAADNIAFVQMLNANSTKGNELAKILLDIGNRVSTNEVRQLIKLGIEAPANGFSPSGFLGKVSEIVNWLIEKAETEILLAQLNSLAIDRYFLTIDLINEALPQLGSLAVAQELICLIEREDKLAVIEAQNRKFFALAPSRSWSSEEVKLTYRLIRESVILLPNPEDNSLDNYIKEFLTVGDRSLATQFSSLPILVIVAFQPLLKERFPKFYQLATDPSVIKSTDNQRALMAGLGGIKGVRNLSQQAAEILGHITQVCSNGRELIEVFNQLRYFGQYSRAEYPFQAETQSTLLFYLRDQGICSALAGIELSNEQKEQLIEAINRLDRRGLFAILLRLLIIYKLVGYVRGIELIKVMLTRLLDKSYAGFRYEHDQAHGQLAILANLSAWRKNLIRRKHIGDISGIQSAMAAVKQVVPVLRHEYTIVFPLSEWNQLASLQALYTEATEAVRRIEDESAKREAIRLKKKLEEAYRILSIIETLERIEIDSFISLPGVISNLRSVCSGYPALAELFNQIFIIAVEASLVGKKVERITVEETDDAFNLLNVGVQPVQTCQRWTEPTNFNQALLAYVLDANKKLILVKSLRDQIICRVVIRLLTLPTSKKKSVPMLLVERPYFLRWQEEVGYCLLQFLIEKAEQVAEDNGGLCAIAFSNTERDSDLWKILEQKLGSLKKKAHLYTKGIKLPDSINEFEYSDVLAGAKLIPSGATLTAKINVVLLKSRVR